MGERTYTLVEVSYDKGDKDRYQVIARRESQAEIFALRRRARHIMEVDGEWKSTKHLEVWEVLPAFGEGHYV